MSATPNIGGMADLRTPVNSEPESPVPGARVAAATHGDGAREAARALATFGPRLGWGLVILGLLGGLGRALESAAEGVPTVAGWTRAVASGASLSLGFGLAGWGMAQLCQMVAALVIDHVERAGSGSRELIAELARATAALERLIEVRKPRSETPDSRAASAGDPTTRLADIDRAGPCESWAETERFVAEFEEEFPGDPTLAEKKEHVDSSRHQAILRKMAQLDAARQVNDPPRVIELYLEIAGALEDEQRGTLERDLAKWFLGVIHRRLRSGHIQPDVVHLATQVAETFAATVEGASMRAALPTLRRSVGLCPRCAQPYTGTADACPVCIAGAFGLSTRPPSDPPLSPS
jgi:hypothetical protein